VEHFRRSGAVILLMALAAPVWGLELRPGVTVGRALILLAVALLALDWTLAPRPRAGLPRAVWLLILSIAALWVWTVANAETWGCGSCGGQLAGFSELAALCVVAAVVCTLAPALRSAVVLAVLAGGTIEAALALAGVGGLTASTADTSVVQGRLAGTFGNPNELGLALAFTVPAGLAALRVQPARWRPAIIGALALVVVALMLTLSRSGILAAAAGGAVVLVLAQPPRSRGRRRVIAGLLAASVVVGIGYPLFTALRQHAETRPVDPALRGFDINGWGRGQYGLVEVGGAGLTNPAAGELGVRTSRAGQGTSHGIGVDREGGTYEVTFEARAASGSTPITYALENGESPVGTVARQSVLSPRWRRLHIRWQPARFSEYARFYVWSSAPSSGFVLRNVTVSGGLPGAPMPTRVIHTRLEGSLYAALVARQRGQQQRDIDSRLFAAGRSFSAFATEPLRGIGWGRFVDYSAAHGDYGQLPTHDEYLRFLAELGAIGALLLALLGAAVLRAEWKGARDELGLALAAMLATGALGLVFINGLVTPTVMMPLAFAAAAACARAGVRAPAITREAAPWWPTYFGPRPAPVPWWPLVRAAAPSAATPGQRAPALRTGASAVERTLARLRAALPALHRPDRVLQVLRAAAPPPAPPAQVELHVPAVREFAPAARALPSIGLPDVGRGAPAVTALPAVRLPAAARVTPPVRELPAVRLPLDRLTHLVPAPAQLRPVLRLPASLRQAPPPPAPARARVRSASPPTGYRPALDGLRAVAVLAVIGYHLTAHVPGGFLGVDVFFVLSGYLITSILLRQLFGEGRIRLTEFWAHRARRLLPAVLVLVLACAFEVSHHEPLVTWQLRQSDLLSTLFYYANWHFIATDQSYFASFLGASPVRHTWTLAIEEQFYIVWPLLVFGIYRLARSPRLLMGLIVAGTVASTIAMALLYRAADPSRAYFGTDTRASTLLVGAGLALLIQRRPEWLTATRGRALSRWAWAPVALVTLAAFAIVTDHSTGYYRGGALVFALLIAIGLFVLEAAPTGRLASALSVAPVRWIGRISYGLYLWYWPVLVWMNGALPGHSRVRALLELAVMFAAATVSYYVIELPIRTGRLPGVGLSRRRLATVMPIAIALVALATVHWTTLGSGSLTAQLTPLTPLACAREVVVDGPYDWCPRRIGPAGAPVVASIGDSTSQALYTGMRVAAARRGWTYIEAAEGGCTVLPLLFVDADTAQDIAQARRCVTDIPRIIAEVQARYRPDVWVLTDRWPIVTLVTRAGTPLAPTDPRRNQPIETAERALLRRLTADGARVLLIPTPPPGEPVDCALHRAAASICENPAFSVLDPVTAELTSTIRAAAAGLRRVTVVPIADVVCPEGGRCPAVIDGTVVRYDGVHYSAGFSRKLVPVIVQRAQQLGLSFTTRRR
jgi:peptidoglycan/LPS O-acetylase OafA/YrhL